LLREAGEVAVEPVVRKTRLGGSLAHLALPVARINPDKLV
jgi:hypothetical protein